MEEHQGNNLCSLDVSVYVPDFGNQGYLNPGPGELLGSSFTLVQRLSRAAEAIVWLASSPCCCSPVIEALLRLFRLSL